MQRDYPSQYPNFASDFVIYNLWLFDYFIRWPGTKNVSELFTWTLSRIELGTTFRAYGHTPFGHSGFSTRLFKSPADVSLHRLLASLAVVFRENVLTESCASETSAGHVRT
jgi:hypothetical protein